jgi:hypothetical protein
VSHTQKKFSCFFLYLAHNIDWHRQQERKTLFPQFNNTQIIALEKKELLKQIFPLSSATTRKKNEQWFFNYQQNGKKLIKAICCMSST